MSKRALLNSYLRYMDRLIAASRHSVPNPLPPLQDSILKAVTENYLETQAKDREAKTQDGQLALQLALRAYQLEHGRDPARRSDLVPSILRQLPDTPAAR